MLTDVLATALGNSSSISVVFKAYDWGGLRTAIQDHCPRVLALDVSLPAGDGLDMVAEIYVACPKTAVLAKYVADFQRGSRDASHHEFELALEREDN
jgi:chemotaxis response regulator CheB